MNRYSNRIFIVLDNFHLTYISIPRKGDHASIHTSSGGIIDNTIQSEIYTFFTYFLTILH